MGAAAKASSAVGGTGAQLVSGPKPFGLQRMLRIMRAICDAHGDQADEQPSERQPPGPGAKRLRPGPAGRAVSAAVWHQVRSMLALGLLAMVGPEEELDRVKLRCNVSQAFVESMVSTPSPKKLLPFVALTADPFPLLLLLPLPLRAPLSTGQRHAFCPGRIH